MEKLARWREPLALTLVVAVGIRLLIGIVAVPLLAGEDAYESVTRSAMYEAGRTVDVFLVLALAASVAWCLRAPATPRAVGLTVAAVVEIGAGVLVALGFGLLGLAEDSPWRVVEFFYTLLGLVVPVLAVAGLLLMLQSSVRRPVPVSGYEPTIQVPQPVPPPALPPTWQPEQATGRSWQSAGDAARGEPGAGWAPGGGAGWQPIPGAGGQAPQGHPQAQPQQRPEHPAP